jgi:hypothetical protein
VLYRVFHQRLQRQRRQRQGAQRLRHVDVIGQPGVHANLQDAQVGLDQRQLVAERVPGHAQAAERSAQVVDEGLEHQPRTRRVVFHQARHVGQRVEQEVRFDLALQQLQAGFGGTALGVDLAVFHREEQVEQEADQQREQNARGHVVRLLACDQADDVVARERHADGPGQQRAEQGHATEEGDAPQRAEGFDASHAENPPAQVEQRTDREADAAGDDEIAPVPLKPAAPVAPGAFAGGEQHETDDREADRDDSAPQQRPDRLQPGRAGARGAVAEPGAPGLREQVPGEHGARVYAPTLWPAPC